MEAVRGVGEARGGGGGAQDGLDRGRSRFRIKYACMCVTGELNGILEQGSWPRLPGLGRTIAVLN